MARLTRSRLARFRQDAGYRTAEDASRALRCSRVYLLEIEQGRAQPSAALIDRMARAYKVSKRRISDSIGQARTDLLSRQLEHLKRA